MDFDYYTVIQKIFDPETTIGAIFFAVVFTMLSTAICRGIRILSRRLEAFVYDVTILRFITPLIQGFVILIFILTYVQLVPKLAFLGNTLLAGAGIFTVFMGLATQNTLSNLVAGVSLMLYRPVNVGDSVLMTTPKGSTPATVQNISLGYTKLIDDTQNEIIVPNSLMMASIIIRTSKVHKERKNLPDLKDLKEAIKNKLP